MEPLIKTAAQVAALIAESESWLGTRYAGDGAVKGSGASCSMLPWAILHNIGHKAPVPPPRAGMFKHDLMPMMETWLDNHPAFYAPVDVKSEPDPGDILLFDAGIGHMALALLHPDIIHSYQSVGVGKSTTSNRRISDRLVGIWRPIYGQE